MLSGFLSGMRRLLGRSSPPDGPPVSSPGSVLIVFDGVDDIFKKKAHQVTWQLGDSEAVLRIRDIWVRFRIRGSVPQALTNGSGLGSGLWIRIRIRPEPAIFASDLQDGH